VYIYIFTHIYIHTHTYVYIYIYTYMYIYYIYICMQVYGYISQLDDRYIGHCAERDCTCAARVQMQWAQWLDLYTILLLPILYGVWHTKGKSMGGSYIAQ